MIPFPTEKESSDFIDIQDMIRYRHVVKFGFTM